MILTAISRLILFYALVCLASERAYFENNCVKTNKDRHIVSAGEIFGTESSFWQYKVCADIRADSLEKWRQRQWGRALTLVLNAFS